MQILKISALAWKFNHQQDWHRNFQSTRLCQVHRILFLKEKLAFHGTQTYIHNRWGPCADLLSRRTLLTWWMAVKGLALTSMLASAQTSYFPQQSTSHYRVAVSRCHIPDIRPMDAWNSHLHDGKFPIVVLKSKWDLIRRQRISQIGIIQVFMYLIEAILHQLFFLRQHRHVVELYHRHLIISKSSHYLFASSFRGNFRRFLKPSKCSLPTVRDLTLAVVLCR